MTCEMISKEVREHTIIYTLNLETLRFSLDCKPFEGRSLVFLFLGFWVFLSLYISLAEQYALCVDQYMQFQRVISF